MLLVETLSICARLISTNAFLRELANRDGLTGIFNRRALNDRLAAELSRVQRIDQPVSFAAPHP
jgi:PleD family two-component response regulator